MTPKEDGHQDLTQRACSVSSSEFEQSCRAFSPGLECETSSPSFSQQARAVKKARTPQPADPGPVPNLTVEARWMVVGHGEKDYLLLEDSHSGDILIPLSQVKRVISGNFSRKLASYTARLVVEPEGANMGGRTPEQAWYWRKAFESPTNVKTEVKRALGEDASTAGHIRIVLLPVVYNAIVAKEKEYNEDSKERQAKCKDFPWLTRFFVEVERLLSESSYVNFIKKRDLGTTAVPAKPSMHTRSNSRIEASGELAEGRRALFRGPTSLEETKAKFMFAYKNERARQANRGPGRRPKRTNMDAPVLPIIPTVSVEIDDRLENIQAELKESKRQRLEQATKIDNLEKKLVNLDGLEKMVAKMYDKVTADSFDHSPMHPFSERQVCSKQRSESTETISSLNPPMKANMVCWDNYGGQIDLDRHASAPPEFHGLGNNELSSTPSYHHSTPMHRQRGGHMERSGNNLSPVVGHLPFKALPQLSCVVGTHHLLTPMEDSNDAPFPPLDFGTTLPTQHTLHSTGAIRLNHLPVNPHYGQIQFPIVGGISQGPSTSRLDPNMFGIFSLGPDEPNLRR